MGLLKGDRALLQVPNCLLGVNVGLKWGGFGHLSINDFRSPLSLLVVDLFASLDNEILEGFNSLSINTNF